MPIWQIGLLILRTSQIRRRHLVQINYAVDIEIKVARGHGNGLRVSFLLNSELETSGDVKEIMLIVIQSDRCLIKIHRKLASKTACYSLARQIVLKYS